MSKAKKSAQPASAAHEGKGFFALAGEAFAVLGEEIIEGKDKVIEVTAAKITAVKKAIKKVTHKKPVKKAPAKKKAVSAPKKATKKVKPAPKKSAPAPKKAVKKKASSRSK